jgi:hypothetical protein
LHKEVLHIGLAFIFTSSVGFMMQDQFLAYLMTVVGIFLLGIYAGERKQFEEIKRFEEQMRNKWYKQ